MRHLLWNVVDFHHKVGSFMKATPGFPSRDVVNMRTRRVTEEIKELLEAMDNGDLIGVADGIADLIYVLVGTALSFGINLPSIWDAIHSANMKKDRIGPDGKCIKPPGWTHPDINAILVAGGIERYFPPNHVRRI